MRYAQYFNGKKGVAGHLWRGRFLSCILDGRSVFEEVRFIETNPVRAGLVEKAEDYAWSSAWSHVSGKLNPVLADNCYLQRDIQDWRAYLAARGDQPILNRIWQRLKTGRPAGEVDFVSGIEGILGRRLQALPRGRPRKAGTLTR
jgi:putative transposase